MVGCWGEEARMAKECIRGGRVEVRRDGCIEDMCNIKGDGDYIRYGETELC